MNLKHMRDDDHRQLYAVESIDADDIAEPNERLREALGQLNGITISETEAVEQTHRQYVTAPQVVPGD
ncbi:MAG: hypothetical protein E6G22_05145 [Actinobacteria bacterium]|nr:MAG: hypothetical protein E6G22_05145 [Actinomycetota bacterium]